MNPADPYESGLTLLLLFVLLALFAVEVLVAETIASLNERDRRERLRAEESKTHESR